jgi:hypothetical protein
MEPMDADDWLKTVERKLQVVQCNNPEKVLLALHQLIGPTTDWFGESLRLCVNLCLLLDNNLCLLLANNHCLLLDNIISLWWDYVFCWTLLSLDIFYLIRILGSSTFNFHLVNRMLITCESSIGDFLHLTLL